MLHPHTCTFTHSTGTKTGIIIGSSLAGAAALILVIAIFAALLTVVLVKKANSRRKKSSKSLIPITVNAAYAVTTHGNVAYTAAEANNYEEYSYNYLKLH